MGTKFKKFLSEMPSRLAKNNVKQPNDMNHWIELLETEFSDSYNGDLVLWRGTRETDYDPEIIKARTRDRDEKGSKVFGWDNLVKIVPAWDAYPNRLRSNMFTTDLSHTELFGDGLYRIFPANNAILAYSPVDFNFFNDWSYIKNHIKDERYSGLIFSGAFLPKIMVLCLPYMNDSKASSVGITLMSHVSHKYVFIEDYEMYFKIFKEKYSGKSFGDLVNKLANLISITKIPNIGTTADSVGMEYLNILAKDFNCDLEKMIQTIFGPDANEFKIGKIKDFSNIKSKRTDEFWTEGECLMIRDELLPEHKRIL